MLDELGQGETRKVQVRLGNTIQDVPGAGIEASPERLQLGRREIGPGDRRETGESVPALERG